MQFLPWLGAQFARTVKHANRSSSSSYTQTAPLPETSTPVSLSADFFFFANLLQPLLSHMQDVDHASSCLSSKEEAASAGTAPAAASPASTAAEATAETASQPGRKKRKKKNEMAKEKQTLQQSHGSPVEWAVAAEGAALLVMLLAALHHTLCNQPRFNSFPGNVSVSISSTLSCQQPMTLIQSAFCGVCALMTVACAFCLHYGHSL